MNVANIRSYRFTMPEMLVIIAAIALMAAMLHPLLVIAGETAEGSMCANNLKQLGTAYLAYADDNGDYGPAVRAYTEGWKCKRGAYPMWKNFLWDGGYVEYPGDDKIGIFGCPDAKTKLYTKFFQDEQCYGATIVKGYYGGFALLNGNDIQLQCQNAPQKPYTNAMRMLKKDGSGMSPAEFPMLQDSRFQNGTHAEAFMVCRKRGYEEDFAGTFMANLRHNQTGNAVFADGHVEALTEARYNELGWNSKSLYMGK